MLNPGYNDTFCTFRLVRVWQNYGMRGNTIRVQNSRSFRCTFDRQRANGGNSYISVPYQNNLGVGSNKWAFNASNSFSICCAMCNASIFRNRNQRFWLWRIVATNRTYSAACSGVIFCKFSICGHFNSSTGNLSFFVFNSFYGLFCGLSGRASSFTLGLCDFRGFPCDFGRFVFDFGRFLFDWMVAPKERPGSGPVKPLAFAATWRINFASFAERAISANQRKNLCWHIISCKVLFRQIRTYENQMYNTFHSAMVFRVQLCVFRGPGPTVSIRP